MALTCKKSHYDTFVLFVLINTYAKIPPLASFHAGCAHPERGISQRLPPHRHAAGCVRARGDSPTVVME